MGLFFEIFPRAMIKTTTTAVVIGCTTVNKLLFRKVKEFLGRSPVSMLGAGCGTEKPSKMLKDVLESIFLNAEVVVEEDSAKTKMFGKTKSERVVKKEDKTLNSEKTLPKKPVVVPAPEAAKPTLTLLPETTRRSSRAKKPSTKAAAAVTKATGKGTKKRCDVM